MLERALAQLDDAKRSGDIEHIGNAHLAAVAALDETLGQSEGVLQRQGRYYQMIEHADAARSAYERAGIPWGQSQAHLVTAAVIAAMAQQEKSKEDRLECVAESLDQCQQALTILSERDDSDYLTLSQAHAVAISILLQLRALVEDEEGQQSLDGMIEAYSENLGAALGWDIRRQGEGNNVLFLARLLRTLAATVASQDERREVLQTAHETAQMAASMLWRTSDQNLAQAALDLAQETKAEVEAPKAAVVHESPSAICPNCKYANSPMNAFCIQCGVALKAPRLAIAQHRTVVCHVCRHPNAPGKKFCTQCGTRLG